MIHTGWSRLGVLTDERYGHFLMEFYLHRLRFDIYRYLQFLFNNADVRKVAKIRTELYILFNKCNQNLTGEVKYTFIPYVQRKHL